MTVTFKVAIIGAGPAGAVLANLLLKINPPKAKLDVTIFESENAIIAHAQGGSLDLGFDTGIKALKKAGLFDEFLRYARYDGESLLVCDRKLTPLFRKKAKPGNATDRHNARPEIDRAKLREILIDSLPDGTIKWGHKLKSVYDDRTLHFENGNTAGGFDLIVGADGAWSRVRAFLAPGPENEPIYCGYEGDCWMITDAEKKAPDVYKMVNKGLLMVAFESNYMAAQQLGNGVIWLYCMEPRQPELPSSVYHERQKEVVFPKTTAESEALREATLERLSDYHPHLRQILEAADHYANKIAFYRAPENFHWASNPRVTILGDAAHLMTPFAGEGVNLAMTDAMDLAATIEKIVNNNSNGTFAIQEHASLIQQFEKIMCRRAAPIYRLSMDIIHDMYPFEGTQEASTTQARKCLDKSLATTFQPKFPWLWWFIHPFVSMALFVVYHLGLYKWLFKE